MPKWIEEYKSKQDATNYVVPKYAKPSPGLTLGDAFTDTGTRLMHGVSTLGGSVIGDALNGINPEIAQATEKLTFGMIPYTKQEQLEANRSSNSDRWQNRTNQTTSAVSNAAVGTMIGKGMEKAAPYIAKGINYLKPSQKFTGYHASFEPITSFKEKFPDNYFAQHGGTDKAIFFTDKVPELQSHLSQRPYLGKYQIKMKNPYVKNFGTPQEGGTSRWADIVNQAEKNGHDGVVIKGIRDNQMDNSTIYVSLNPKNISHKEWIKSQSTNLNEGSIALEKGVIDPAVMRAKQTKIDKGIDWMNNWYSHPETKSRIAKLSKEHGLEEGYFKDTFSPVDFNDAALDKIAINKGREATKDNLLGVSVRNVGSREGNIYLRSKLPLNRVEGITIHELTHDITSGKFPMKAVRDYHNYPKYNQEQLSEWAKGINPVLNEEQTFHRYLTKPTETYARLMQLRRWYDIKPGDQVSQGLADIMMKPEYNRNSGINPEWFDTFKSSTHLKDMLNTLPAVGAAYLGTKE